MKFKNLTFILAVLLIAAVALGSVSAAEDIADDTLAIDEVAEVDEVSEVPAVTDIDESSEIEVDDSPDTNLEDETFINVNSDSDLDDVKSKIAAGGYTLNFTATTFDISTNVGNNTVLIGNGATLSTANNYVFNVTNVSRFSISGFSFYASGTKSYGIVGTNASNGVIDNCNFYNTRDGININQIYENLTITNNHFTSVSRDAISLVNHLTMTDADFNNFVASTINGNTITGAEYGMFFGGNFKGTISENYINDADCGMQFLGKAAGTNGNLNANILNNTFNNVDLGIDMSNPGVKYLNIMYNSISTTDSANDYSIDVNENFTKLSDGEIYVYYNLLNGLVNEIFQNETDIASGNTGTGAYIMPISNGLNSNRILMKKLGDSENADSGVNVILNPNFDNDASDWTLSNAQYSADGGLDGSGAIVVSNIAGATIIQNVNLDNVKNISFYFKHSHDSIVFIIIEGSNMVKKVLTGSEDWALISADISDKGFVGEHAVTFKVSCNFGDAYVDNITAITIPPQTAKQTYIDAVVQDNIVLVTLTDEDNAPVSDATVTYTVNGGEAQTLLTNATGEAVIEGLKGTNTIVFNYAGVEGEYEPIVDESKELVLPSDKTGDDIQNLINDVEDGGVIDLGENCVYEIADGTIFTLDKKVTIKGNNVTIKASGASQGDTDALFIATKAGTSFEGITFINTDGHKAYGQEVSGRAIQLAIENGTVNNCAFIDWNSGVYGRGASYCLINNSYFNGSSELVTGAGKGEKGTKAINLMGSHDITVTYCTFEGQVLDGISIASNSGHNIMTDNTFIDNVYAIYFGGASTEGCVIANNSFIRCGYCPDVSDAINKKVTVLSTQKACNGFIIADNSIEAVAGSTFIIAEAGNTAHGYPSTIGDINITGNTLTVTEGATPETITFIKIVSNEGELNPYAPINISGNTIAAGVTPVKVWYADWGSEDQPVIPAADPVVTSLEIVDVSTATKKVTVKLVDIGGEALAGETISYSINGGAVKTTETDVDGLAVLDATENGIIAIAFAGNDNFKEAETSIQFTGTVTKTNPVITAGAMTTTAKVGKVYTATLKDKNGKALVGQKVTFYFNGQSKTVTTDEKGIAKININLAAKGNYPITISYLGNDYNNAVVAVKNIKVNVQKTKAVFKKATLKVKKAKKVKFTLKDASGKAIKGKKITIKVNKKTFTGKTNAKGVATIKVKVAKKGKFTAVAKFAGDNTYKAITKKVKFTVKK